MSVALSRCLCRILSRQTAPSSSMLGEHHPAGPWFAPVMTLKTSAPLRAQPKKKKKGIDPKQEHLSRERLKRKVRKLEKVSAEFIPIEDFFTPEKCSEETRHRSVPRLSFEESEGRALLLKEWCRYKQKQHTAEMQAVEFAVEAQREALEELKLESEKLYQAALKPDTLLFPFTHEGPAYTPRITNYEAPIGKYIDTTRVYKQ
ncbi:large ribosomal subunit protein mL40 [Cottoperca gobio]|uniref:Large ribosomal subunit protein mL40 n=1 Tax=Cottoperca gobio TaxID=56716 RepID=A0A6J2QED5_COTGO|nr:39S ribosomal protein L40, mitochondrial [Cottoperca gobio]